MRRSCGVFGQANRLPGCAFFAKEGGTLDIGPTWLFHPMTIDEILVLDRALDGAEFQTYMTSVQRLSELADTAHD